MPNKKAKDRKRDRKKRREAIKIHKRNIRIIKQAYRDKNSNNIELLNNYLMFINNIIARL